MKKSLAVMLALIMVLCMIPTTAFAADIIDQKNSVSIYKGEPINYIFLRNFPGGSITKQENEEVTWQRLPRYTSKCGRCNNVVEEVIPDLYCINPDKNIEITNTEVIGKYGVRVASWKGNDVYNGYPCFEFYCKAAKAGETDVTVTYFYNYNYPGARGYCKCGNRVAVPAQTNWYQESVTFHVTCETQEPPTPGPSENPEPPTPGPSENPEPPTPGPSENPEPPTPGPSEPPTPPTPGPSEPPTPPTPGPSEPPTPSTPGSSENPEPSPSTNPNPTPTPTPGGGNGGGGHWHPTTTPVPVIVIPPKTGDMTIWQSILRFLGIR